MRISWKHLLGLALFGQAIAVLAQPQEVSLTIRLANEKTQFHVGEIIPIELSFSSTVPETYEMDTNTYDRSGRLGLEGFNVTPSGRDPLHSHYGEGLQMGFMGGGLTNALCNASNWLLSSGEIDELEKLAIGDMVAVRRWKSPAYINIVKFNDGTTQFNVAGYSTESMQDLCNKLSQFPKGMVFKLSLVNSDENIRNAADKIRDYASAHSLILEENPQNGSSSEMEFPLQ